MIGTIILAIISGVICVIWYYCRPSPDYLEFANHMKEKRQLGCIKSATIHHMSLNWKSDREAQNAIERFVQLLKFNTTSYDMKAKNDAEINELLKYLQEVYPLIHSQPFINRIVVNSKLNQNAILYEIIGTDSKLQKFMLNCHVDVVPATKADGWQQDPFKPLVTNVGGIEYICARGTMDDKNSVVGIFEGLEKLLRGNWRPNRSFYIAVDNTEEVKGQGAIDICNYLLQRKEKLAFVHDEGLIVFEPGILPGLRKTAAMIAVAEKGTCEVELVSGGGENKVAAHSSAVQPGKSPLVTLAKVCVDIDKAQSPLFIEGKSDLLRTSVEGISNEGSLLLLKLAMTSIGMKLLKPVLKAVLWGKEVLALIVTTSAVTVFEVIGQTKTNVVPRRARAVINHRIHPEETIADVVARDRRFAAAVSPDITVKVIPGSDQEPCAAARTDANALGFQAVRLAALRALTGPGDAVDERDRDILVTTGLFIANADSRHYQLMGLTDDCYRFLPSRVNKSRVKGIHGVNEMISKTNLIETINFYISLMLIAGECDTVDEMWHSDRY